jgi:hypothetical protein
MVRVGPALSLPAVAPRMRERRLGRRAASLERRPAEERQPYLRLHDLGLGLRTMGSKWLVEFTEGGGQMALISGEKGRSGQVGAAPAPPAQHEAAQEREGGGGVSSAAAGFVLEQRSVAGVVVAVLDRPAGADNPGGIGGAEHGGAGEEAAARRDGAVALTGTEGTGQKREQKGQVKKRKKGD